MKDRLLDSVADGMVITGNSSADSTDCKNGRNYSNCSMNGCMTRDLRGTGGWEGCPRCRATGFVLGKLKRIPGTKDNGGTKFRAEVPCNACGSLGIVELTSCCTPQKRQRLESTEDAIGAGAGAGGNSTSVRVAPAKNANRIFIPMAPCSVVIVGGGLGGCALALALQQRNIECTVLEKDGTFDERSQGYGLTLQQAATTLKRLGFCDLKKVGIASMAHTSLLPDGQVLNEYGRMVHSTTKAFGGTRGSKGDAQRFNVQLPRQALRRMLFDALRPGTVRWNACFKRYERPADGRKAVAAVYSTPDAAHNQVNADILVGADGIWSNVRAQLLGRDAPRYLGVIVILGRAPCAHPLAEDRVFQTLGGQTRFYAMPFIKGVTMWQLSFPLPLEQARSLSAQGPDALLQEATLHCGKWHEPIPEMLAGTRAEDVTGYPGYDRPPPEQLVALHDTKSGSEYHVEKRIVLLGDASHPMSMFRGQGANQALLDAWDLARKVASCEHLGDALMSFDTEMTKRVRLKVEKSAEAAVVLHTDQSIQYRMSRQIT